MQTSVIEVRSAGELASLRPAWDGLLSRARGYSFSQTPDYAFLAIEIALRRGDRAFIVQVSHNVNLVGGWCLTSKRNGLLVLARPASCGSHEEYGEPLVDVAFADRAEAALVEACRAIPVDHMAVTGVADAGPLAAAMAEEGSYLGHIEGFATSLSRYKTWEAYSAQASRSHLYNLRRARRRLEDQGEVVINWCRTPREVETVLRWAWKNKQAWAKARRHDTPYLRNDAVPDFFVELARRVDLKTFPLVSFISLNGEFLAAQMNLVGDGVFELMFTTFAESQARWSPGDLLIQHSFQWAITRGLDFDFRILRAAYKERVSDTVTRYGSYEIVMTPLARVVRPLESRLAPPVRRMRRAPGKAWQITKKLAAQMRKRRLVQHRG